MIPLNSSFELGKITVVSQNYTKAFDWYIKAHNCMNPDATFRVIIIMKNYYIAFIHHCFYEKRNTYTLSSL